MSYYVKLRINKACELLMKDDTPIKSVSNHLRFGTVQYFCTQFKKTTGLTPLQFKKAAKSNSDYTMIRFENV